MSNITNIELLGNSLGLVLINSRFLEREEMLKEKQKQKYYEEDVDVNLSDDIDENNVPSNYYKYIDLYNDDDMKLTPLRRYTAKKVSKAARDRKKFSRRRLEDHLEQKALRSRSRDFDEYDFDFEYDDSQSQHSLY